MMKLLFNSNPQKIKYFSEKLEDFMTYCRLIEDFDRSIIVAADVPNISDLRRITLGTIEIPEVTAFKLGLTLGLGGLEKAVREVKDNSRPGVKTIFDLQKAGNDIPPMGVQFARDVANAGCDAAILFPFAGPKTQEAWTEACFKAGLEVLVGGIMTHEKFLVSEGGYISDDAPERIYRLGAQMGVKHFVVPGTKLNWVRKIKGFLTEELGEDEYELTGPGFITQGGDLSECALIAGKRFHGIVGTAIYNNASVEDVRLAALSCVSQIRA